MGEVYFLLHPLDLERAFALRQPGLDLGRIGDALGLLLADNRVVDDVRLHQCQFISITILELVEWGLCYVLVAGLHSDLHTLGALAQFGGGPEPSAVHILEGAQLCDLVVPELELVSVDFPHQVVDLLAAVVDQVVLQLGLALLPLCLYEDGVAAVLALQGLQVVDVVVDPQRALLLVDGDDVLGQLLK